MNFKWITKNKVSRRIEQLNFQRNIQIEYKLTSPTLTELKQTQKVQKIREFYENERIFEAHNGTANHLISEKNVYCRTTYQQLKISERQLKFDLINYEEEYIKKLEDISNIFARLINNSRGYLTKIIRSHHVSISGCLNDIMEIHKNKILPIFEGRNVNFMLQSLLALLKNNEFYPYVTHAMLYNSTFPWLENFQPILAKCGMSNFIKLDIDDIIRLYDDWIKDVSKYLIENPRENASEIALCLEIEQKIEHLLKVIDDAKKIACIKEVSKNDIQALEKLYHILEKKNAISHPTLILFPRYDCHHGYRNPLDLLKLGQFVRIWNEKSMLSETSKCYYDTNLFIFERCIIYTIIINDNHFVYNGHFWIKDCEFKSILKDDKPMILAVLKSADRQLILDNTEFVGAIMRLNEQHKHDGLDGAEIEIPFDEHLRILSNIESTGLRRLNLACE